MDAGDTGDAQRQGVELEMPGIRPPRIANITDSIARRGRRSAQITSYDVLTNSPRSSTAASEPQMSSDENEREDENAEDLAVNYRRKVFRRGDYMNEDAVVCYDSRRGTYVRSASKLATLTNSYRLFITSRNGLVFVHDRVAEFFKFLAHDSGQAARDWGRSLNLGKPGVLEEILADPGLREAAQSILRNSRRRNGENTKQGGVFRLIYAIQQFSRWMSPEAIHNYRTVAGGHFAYSRDPRDRNTTRPAAIVAEIDAVLESKDQRRRVVFESKRPGNLQTATTGSAMVQMYTGVLGLRASVSILSTGTQFGFFWFEYHQAVRIHKVLDIHELIELEEDDVEKLIKLAAHLAFYASDPLALMEPAAKKARVTGAKVTGGKNGGLETTQSSNAGGKLDKARKSGTSSASKKADAWEELTIEGPTGKTAVCTTLREDIDEETRLKILGEIEPEF